MSIGASVTPKQIPAPSTMKPSACARSGATPLSPANISPPSAPPTRPPTYPCAARVRFTVIHLSPSPRPISDPASSHAITRVSIGACSPSRSVIGIWITAARPPQTIPINMPKKTHFAEIRRPA